MRTWAPRGQTPVLQYHFGWTTISAIAGITWRSFYFRLHRGAIRTRQVIEFLLQLMRHVPGKLLIVWDRLGVHRSAMVREFVEATEGRITLEFLPAYAPELNVVEYIWAYWKQHELPNLCPDDLCQLSGEARRALRRMRRRPKLIRSFWKQTPLPF